jgi:hypothetical protein
MATTSGYYTYLISSLPSLHFGTKPPLSFESFLDICKGLVSDRDLEIIRDAGSTGMSGYDRDNPTLEKWHRYDTMLRNELVKVRAARKKTDPKEYLRDNGTEGTGFTHAALNAQRNPSLVDGERALDLERWRVLDGLACNHYFDLDSLLIYAHKLLILERWERIREADTSELLEEALKRD